MVGGVGVLLGWVVWWIILGGFLLFGFLLLLCSSVVRLRGSTSPRSGHIFLPWFLMLLAQVFLGVLSQNKIKTTQHYLMLTRCSMMIY